MRIALNSPSISCNAGLSIHAHGLCVAVPSSALYSYWLQVARLHPFTCSQRRPCDPRVMPPCVRACCVVWRLQVHILHTTYTWVHMSTNKGHARHYQAASRPTACAQVCMAHTLTILRGLSVAPASRPGERGAQAHGTRLKPLVRFSDCHGPAVTASFGGLEDRAAQICGRRTPIKGHSAHRQAFKGPSQLVHAERQRWVLTLVRHASPPVPAMLSPDPQAPRMRPSRFMRILGAGNIV